MAKYEHRRTCSRCAHIWYVPAEVAKAKQRKQAKMAGWATPVVGNKRQALRAEQAAVDAHNAALQDAQRCPSCGSGAFSDERVRM